MKTKYVKVPVSERLPEKRGFYIMFVKDNPIPATRYFGKAGFEHNNIESWLEEKEDHSEEMLSMLEELISYEDRCRAKNEPAIGNGWYNKAKQLINKVKDNGK